jgi:hypothetical protein
MKPSAKGGLALCCFDEDTGVGGSCYRRKGVLLFLSSHTTFKFLGAKEEAEEVFDDEID